MPFVWRAPLDRRKPNRPRPQGHPCVPTRYHPKINGGSGFSLDYLIGDPACRGRGLAALAIRAFVADCWHAHPDAQDIVVPVSAGNRASWRSLENAGFVRVAEGDLVPDNPIDPPDHVVYRIRRTDLPGGGTAGVTAPGRQKGPPPTRG